MDYLLDNLPGLTQNIFVVLDAIFKGPLAGFAYVIIFVAVLTLVLGTVVHGRGEN